MRPPVTTGRGPTVQLHSRRQPLCSSLPACAPALAAFALCLWTLGGAADARANQESALLPLINQGVAPANAVVLEQSLRAALANQERNLQAADRTVAIVEGARTSGMDCDVAVRACALQLGALTNVGTAYVGRVLAHEDRGFWVELTRYDIANQVELEVRRTAVTLDEPGLTDAMNALVTGTIHQGDVPADLRTASKGFPLDVALYIGGGAAMGVGFVGAITTGALVAMTYGVSQEKVTDVEQAAADVGTVRLLSTTAAVVGVVSAILVTAGVAGVAAGTAVTVGELEE